MGLLLTSVCEGEMMYRVCLIISDGSQCVEYVHA